MAGRILWAVTTLPFIGIHAVDRTKFRTCKDSGFCRRHRSSNMDANAKFHVLKDSVKSHGTEGITAILQNDHVEHPLKLTLKFYKSGVTRIQVQILSKR
jgi:hypothetical protein